ncbi:MULTISPECIES: protease inhibitor I42 family protein [unclassified Streptomyces]|uniref:protease inhibitor I42 family protein n=1 Tax=unclassified Streptomyces TaxID=2593676 RepID=UPI0004BD9D7F|nr:MULTISPECIES: protease inhibitor I42 family protein [unclassified Streptomyces]
MEVRSIVLGPDEPYELRLTGRGARGYVWTWQVTGDADMVTVAEAPEAPPAAGVAAPPPGAPVERTYVIRARPPGGGRARIRFAQVRPPYPDEAPYDEFVLDVEVVAVSGGA